MIFIHLSTLILLFVPPPSSSNNCSSCNSSKLAIYNAAAAPMDVKWTNDGNTIRVPHRPLSNITANYHNVYENIESERHSAPDVLLKIQINAQFLGTKSSLECAKVMSSSLPCHYVMTTFVCMLLLSSVLAQFPPLQEQTRASFYLLSLARYFFTQNFSF